MPSTDLSPLWTTLAPPQWPAPPDEMTISTLAEIEACPRRWALASADYPALWAGRGYPPRVVLSSLAGSVVHLALETVTREMVRAECPTVHDVAAIQVMREFGGYTKLLNACVGRVVTRFAGNPRASRLVEPAARSLQARVPELRVRAQRLLGLVRLQAQTGDSSATPTIVRTGLSNGAYPEVELRARHIGWKGKADLLVLSDETCELLDFKTGAEDDSHTFQLQVYALLWRHDEELNPDGRPASKLTLAYDGKEVEVAVPSAERLQVLEHDLVGRRDVARKAVADKPPEARPTPDNCRYCGVRQLCDRYWTEETQRALEAAPRAEDVPFRDFELTITGRHGSASWDAILVSGPGASGRGVVVRSVEGGLDLQAGKRVRILDALAAAVNVENAQPLVVTMTRLSEVFTVS